jgi:regulator of replication initiation timing
MTARAGECAACGKFHETGDCPDEFEQMLDLHHALLVAKDAEIETLRHSKVDPIAEAMIQKLLTENAQLRAEVEDLKTQLEVNEICDMLVIQGKVKMVLKDGKPAFQAIAEARSALQGEP